MRKDLGREPTPQEAAKNWSRYFLSFGARLAEIDGAVWTADLPRGTKEERCAKELLRLACQAGCENELIDYLARLHMVEQTQPGFQDRFRDSLRRSVDLLIARAMNAFGPFSGESITAETKDAPASDPEVEKSMTDSIEPRKIFLSHKSKDKPRVRRFCEILEML